MGKNVEVLRGMHYRIVIPKADADAYTVVKRDVVQPDGTTKIEVTFVPKEKVD